MELTHDDVVRLAELSRLEITEAEKDTYAREFSSILNYVSEIQSVQVEGVQDIGSVNNVFRADVAVEPSESFRKQFLQGAPHTKGNYVQVKQIL